MSRLAMLWYFLNGGHILLLTLLWLKRTTLPKNGGDLSLALSLNIDSLGLSCLFPSARLWCSEDEILSPLLFQTHQSPFVWCILFSISFFLLVPNVRKLNIHLLWYWATNQILDERPGFADLANNPSPHHMMHKNRNSTKTFYLSCIPWSMIDHKWDY